MKKSKSTKSKGKRNAAAPIDPFDLQKLRVLPFVDMEGNEIALELLRYGHTQGGELAFVVKEPTSDIRVFELSEMIEILDGPPRKWLRGWKTGRSIEEMAWNMFESHPHLGREEWTPAQIQAWKTAAQLHVSEIDNKLKRLDQILRFYRQIHQRIRAGKIRIEEPLVPPVITLPRARAIIDELEQGEMKGETITEIAKHILKKYEIKGKINYPPERLVNSYVKKGK